MVVWVGEGKFFCVSHPKATLGYNPNMKYLRGNRKRYFSLAIIAMYSTWHKLARFDSNYQYHKLAYDLPHHKTSPPA